MVPPVASAIPRVAAAADPAIPSMAVDAFVAVPAIITEPAGSVTSMNERQALGDLWICRAGIDRRRICFSPKGYQQGSQ